MKDDKGSSHYCTVNQVSSRATDNTGIGLIVITFVTHNGTEEILYDVRPRSRARAKKNTATATAVKKIRAAIVKERVLTPKANTKLLGMNSVTAATSIKSVKTNTSRLTAPK